MKEKLKTKYDALYWAQTHEARMDDLSKLSSISMKSNWPMLFTQEGVLYAYLYLIFS